MREAEQQKLLSQAQRHGIPADFRKHIAKMEALAGQERMDEDTLAHILNEEVNEDEEEQPEDNALDGDAEEVSSISKSY